MVSEYMSGIEAFGVNLKKN